MLRKLICFLLILGLGIHEIQGHNVRGLKTSEDEVVTTEVVSDENGNYAVATVRRLQEMITYVYSVTFVYTFPEDFFPEGARLAEVRDGIRLTQIFYNRLIASLYPDSYYRATCDYAGTENDIGVDVDSLGRLRISVDTTLTTTYIALGVMPDGDEAFSAVTNFDRTVLLTQFLYLASPGVFLPL